MSDKTDEKIFIYIKEKPRGFIFIYCEVSKALGLNVKTVSKYFKDGERFGSLGGFRFCDYLYIDEVAGLKRFRRC